MRRAELVTTALPCSGLWTTYVRATMDPEHRLVLRWCAHLDFEDVLLIDHSSIYVAHCDPARSLGKWRIAFGNGRLPIAIVPFGLVNATHQYIVQRPRVSGAIAAHNVPVFGESYGEPITRTSLSDSIRRAITLVRLSDAILGAQ